MSKNVDLTYYTDIIFDASQSSINISSITMDGYKTNDSILTINDLSAGDYTFTIEIQDNDMNEIMNKIEFDKETVETFGGDTQYNIGWKKVMYCDEGHDKAYSLIQYTSSDVTYNKQ